MQVFILLVSFTTIIVSGTPWNTHQQLQGWNKGCKSEWVQKPQSQNTVQGSGWGSSSSNTNTIPNENLVKPGDAWPRPRPTQQKWNTVISNNENLVKPVFSAWPGRPSTSQSQQQNQQQWTSPSISNANLVKPVFSAWPGNQQQWNKPSSTSNANLVKPVFSAWPGQPSTSQNQGWQRPKQRELVDVPYTIEIIRHTQKPSGSGWSRF